MLSSPPPTEFNNLKLNFKCYHWVISSNGTLQDAPEACPLLSEAEVAMAGTLCSFECADLPTARPMGTVPGLHLPLTRPCAQLGSPHGRAASMHASVEGPHATAAQPGGCAPFAWMDEVFQELPASGSPRSVASGGHSCALSRLRNFEISIDGQS